jgi:N-acetylmuramic acid 6-phosphate etherase
MQAPDIESLASLPTEARNSNSTHIDQFSTLDMLAVINREDQSVALTVERELPEIARAVDAIAERFAQGGRLFYVGAGTSGRLGVLDASECPPTFSVVPTLFQGIIAGGDSALRRSSEHSEDSPEQGAEDLWLHGFGSVDGVSVPDTLVGIAASGRTPYVLGAIAHAKGLGYLTIGLSCVPGSALARSAEIAITPDTGPEVITGSTRMKAGTATKLVLNMLSTGLMVRAGAVFENLMVNVQPTNEKLIDRAERIIMAATGCGRDEAARVLSLAQDDAGSQAGIVKVAIVMQRLGVDRAAAEGKLAAAKGVLRAALAKL